jgi:hypothetical protein
VARRLRVAGLVGGAGDERAVGFTVPSGMRSGSSVSKPHRAVISKKKP